MHWPFLNFVYVCRTTAKSSSIRNEKLQNHLRHWPRYKWLSARHHQTNSFKNFITNIKERKLKWHGHVASANIISIIIPDRKKDAGSHTSRFHICNSGAIGLVMWTHTWQLGGYLRSTLLPWWSGVILSMNSTLAWSRVRETLRSHIIPI